MYSPAMAPGGREARTTVSLRRDANNRIVAQTPSVIPASYQWNKVFKTGLSAEQIQHGAGGVTLGFRTLTHSGTPSG